MNLQPDFVDSYLRYQEYPLTIASRARYSLALPEYRERLDRRSLRLFISPGDQSFVIPFREVVKDSTGKWQVRKFNALDEQKLKWKLGDTAEPDANNPAKVSGFYATLPDPRCRFIFLVSDSALAPLELTKDALLRIMTYHQVMPAYIDFLLAFGTQDEDRELRFTRFRTQTVLQNPVPGHVVADLHRSGRQHEICYNLKAVAPKDRGKSQYDRDQWKIRQAAVYHRFDLGSGTALWIVADPRESVKKAVQGVLREGPIPSNANMAFATMPDAFQSSLDTHLILVNWASTSWRWNIQSLEEAIDDMTRPMLLFDFKDSRQPDILPRSVTLVQEYEDKVNETLMVLESNIKICTSLQTSYTDLVEDENFPQNEKKACRSAVQKFSEQVQEYIFDLQMQADRARVLSKVASGRKTLALQQLQTQLAVKQEALATSMWQFSEQGQKEAIAMRIITVITLLYLPPTFVCTFFGTDVIKYQDGGQDAVYFSTAALKSFFEVTIPLWIITILVVYIFNKTESTKREKRALELVSRLPELWTPSSTGTTHQTSPHENKHNMLEKRHMQGH